MDEHGVVTEPGAVRFERVLPGPIERVWKYLTDSESRGKWFAAGEMDLRVGGAVELIFDHAALSAEKQTPERYKAAAGYRMRGRITRCEPPRLLSYTWDETVSVGPSMNSEVSFELSPRGADVLLVLTHRRLASAETLLSVCAGWHSHLGILTDQINGVEPRPFWSTHARLEAEYQRRQLPA